ncbi:hypothetical protein ACLOJK_000794 [Asimina triloba]
MIRPDYNAPGFKGSGEAIWTLQTASSPGIKKKFKEVRTGDPKVVHIKLQNSQAQDFLVPSF